MTERSPLIIRLAWGKIEVDFSGERHTFKDCKLWPGGGRAWDWNESGTRHSPGIQIADIEEVLDHSAEVLVLSRGMFSRLGICAETEAYLHRRGIPYYILNTEQAVALYNDLARQGKRVGGVFHSTC